MTQKFRNKDTFEAIQFDGTNVAEIAAWTNYKVTLSEGTDSTDNSLYLETAEGNETVFVGYWVMADDFGGFETCAADTFAERYEVVKK